MSKVFLVRFIEELEPQLPEHEPQELKDEICRKDFVVDAKCPFGSVHSVIE